MKTDLEVIEVAAEVLSSKLGRSVEEIIANGLSAYDFTADGVELSFEDGSAVKFRYSFFVEDRQKGVIAVFTEHCGYHLFSSVGAIARSVPQRWVEIDEEAYLCCERFKEAVYEGKIVHAGDTSDETEWYLPESGHIYYCPFCGSFIKGKGYGMYHDRAREGKPNNGGRL